MKRSLSVLSLVILVSLILSACAPTAPRRPDTGGCAHPSASGPT